MKRQVPIYLIIGNGRVAHHLQYYFSQLAIHFLTWNRTQSAEKLAELAAQATHILLLIKDSAIEEFLQLHLQSIDAILIHCSGSLATELAYGAHPLIGFIPDLYEPTVYPTISFVIDDDAPAFSDLLPGLPNPHFRLAKNLKAKYHAICVLGGNLSCLLWSKLFSVFENEFHLPAQAAHPYLLQQTKNLQKNYHNALTGPLIRNDQKTIENNLIALSNDPFKQIYESFVRCYQQIETLTQE